jgi:lipid-A-disaccharide synthase-like uncharacterized protein
MAVFAHRRPDGHLAEWISAWRWPAAVLASSFLAAVVLMPLDAIDVGLPTGWLLFGFTAQAIFTARMALQWAQSERAGKSVITPSFWWWSIAGSLMLGFYFALRGDPVAYLGQLFGTLIYVRNLWLLDVSRRWAVAAMGVMLAVSACAYLRLPAHDAREGGLPWLWLAFGFGAQALFTARMLVQWLASERAKASVVPKAFWWLSLAGGFALGVYFVRRGDPVGLVGQLFGCVVYARNLWLMRINHEKVVVAERAEEIEAQVMAARRADAGVGTR